MVERAGSATAATNRYAVAEAGPLPAPTPPNDVADLVPAIGSDEGGVERVQSGGLPTREGETDAQCAFAPAQGR
jgi:hypothetical protein